MRTIQAVLRAGLLACGPLVATSAFADGTAECLQAASKGQVLRDSAKIVEARELFVVCARPECPAMVRSDCAGWLEAADKNVPTVVIRAKNIAGADVTDFRLVIDGMPLATNPAGVAIPLDPGSHEFHFQLPDGTGADRTVVVLEGQKNQPLEVVLGKGAVERVADAFRPGQSRTTSPWKVVGVVLGGTGVVSVALGATFGILASSAWSQAKKLCGGNPGACTDTASASSYQSTAETEGWVSTVTFIAGGALIAGGAVLFFTAGSHSETAAPSTGAVLTPTLGPGLAGLSLSGRF
jgi:hypothetical protein